MTNPVGFGEFKVPLGKLAPLTEFRTRAGDALRYRAYPAWSENLLILFHGIAGDSRIFASLASAIAASGAAQVVTPDFRGHGENTAPDVPLTVPKDTQLEEDFEELLIHLRQKMPATKLWVGGHSFGAGFALRLLCDSSHAHGGFLWAPFLPTAGAAEPAEIPRWLEKVGREVRIEIPPAFRGPTDVILYDESFFRAGRVPGDWRTAWEKQRERQPGRFLQIFAGGSDQIFSAAEIVAAVSGVPGVTCESLAGLSHMGVAMSPVAVQRAVLTLVQRSS